MKDRQADGRTDRQTDGQTDGQTDDQTVDGQTDGHLECLFTAKKITFIPTEPKTLIQGE